MGKRKPVSVCITQELIPISEDLILRATVEVHPPREGGSRLVLNKLERELFAVDWRGFHREKMRDSIREAFYAAITAAEESLEEEIERALIEMERRRGI